MSRRDWLAVIAFGPEFRQVVAAGQQRGYFKRQFIASGRTVCVAHYLGFPTRHWRQRNRAICDFIEAQTPSVGGCSQIRFPQL
jgi:hypothetical protein